MYQVLKRTGETVGFDIKKIENAIVRAFVATNKNYNEDIIQMLALRASARFADKIKDDKVSIEDIQDGVESTLAQAGYEDVAKAYILYRAERSRVREMNTRLMKTYEDIAFTDAADSDVKRENANINGDSAMGAMLKFGSEGAKQFYDMYVLNQPNRRRASAAVIYMMRLARAISSFSISRRGSPMNSFL